MLIKGFARCLRSWTLAAAGLGFGLAVPVAPAAAQSIAAVVNGDPITSEDVDNQIKFLRIIKQNATRDAAVEDLIADRLKLREANKFGIDASDNDLTQTLNRLAKSLNTQPEILATALQRAKADSSIIRSHLRAVAAWNNYVRGRNKALNVSEEDISAALAKDASRARDATDFSLQQIVFVLPVGATGAMIEQRTREAQALRNRFSDCASGLALARSLPDVAIKPPITRTAKDMSAATRAALDQTPKGRLTSPDHTAAGIEVIAVCGKTDEADRTTVRDTVQADLVTERLQSVADELYKTLRASAVVEKH